MAIVNKDSRPVAVRVTSATPFESTLVEDTLKECFTTKDKVKRHTGDKAYDSDELDEKLKKKGVELNAPHKKKRTQDGRKLRGYKNRCLAAGKGRGGGAFLCLAAELQKMPGQIRKKNRKFSLFHLPRYHHYAT